MKTVQAQWASYMQQCMPAGAPDLQINEGKLCFMAGANAMFKIMTVMAAEMSEADAMKFLSDVSKEIEDFAIQYAVTGKVP